MEELAERGHPIKDQASYWDTPVQPHCVPRITASQESVPTPHAHGLLRMCPERYLNQESSLGSDQGKGCYPRSLAKILSGCKMNANIQLGFANMVFSLSYHKRILRYIFGFYEDPFQKDSFYEVGLKKNTKNL